MELTGDTGGVAHLQDLKVSNKEYLKFLITEARTVFERHVDFKGKDGVTYRLTWVPQESKLVVSKP